MLSVKYLYVDNESEVFPFYKNARESKFIAYWLALTELQYFLRAESLFKSLLWVENKEYVTTLIAI